MDVHNLNFQRFYNTSWYAYGQNPEYTADLIIEDWLPEEELKLVPTNLPFRGTGVEF